MHYKTSPPRLLIWCTLIVLIGISVAVTFAHKRELPESIVIDQKGQPMIGYSKAKVHVVVFEEPKCVNCRHFTLDLYPQLKKQYIDTNKITYTVVPVAFMPGAMPAAVALLCVYHQDALYPNSDLFFKYLHTMYEHQPEETSDWATPETLARFAKMTSPAIDLSKLQKCVKLDTFRVKIQQNTDYGTQLMGGQIATPTVYVNGMMVEDMSFDGISKLIDESLEMEGVH